MLFKQPIPSYAEALEKAQKLGMSRMKQPSKSFVNSPSHTGESMDT